MSPTQRATVIRWATLLLTIAAFAGSYRHGVQWVTGHTPGHGADFQRWFWIRVTAGLPEVMVALSVLKAQDNPRDMKAWTVGGSAVAWQLWANGSEAGHGLSGLIIALWPAWAALSALWLTSHDPAAVARVIEPPSRATGPRKRVTVAQTDGSFTPGHVARPVALAADLAPDAGPSDDPGQGGPADTAMARGVAWAIGLETLPSRADIQNEIGCSTKTASRIRTAASAARAAREGESN